MIKRYINTKKIILVTIVACLTTTMFYACKKDTVDNETTETCEMSENGKIVYNKLLNFQQNLRNTEKDAILMTVDSAQWYIEAYYNVTSGYPDSGYMNFDVDSSSYILNIDENNMVSLSDISVLLNNMQTHLDNLNMEYGEDNPHMIVGDVKLTTIARSVGVDVLVTTGIGIGISQLYTEFNENELWYYGECAGRCDLTPPTPPYSDAGEQLEWRFNNANPAYVPMPTCQGSIKIIATELNEWDTGLDNSLIYGEWIAGPKIIPCYSGEYWNDYLANGYTLFYTNESNGGLIPDGDYYFTSVDIFSFSPDLNVNGVDGFYYYHGYQSFYSEYECIPELNN